MKCPQCGNFAAIQATFCTRCGTRLANPPRRAAVLRYLATRVARPWRRFIRESTMAFTIVSAFFTLVLGLAVWAALSAHQSGIGARSETKNSIPASGSADKSTFARAIDAEFARQCIPVAFNTTVGA
jgi:uncharacterized membrane protein YvbJ